MLYKVIDNRIESDEKLFRLNSEVSVFAQILSIPSQSNSSKTALFLHGGGVTGNHTLSERPSRWLLNKGLFTRIIMPDRRGAGLSTPFTYPLSLMEQARDMSLLLDHMHIENPLSVIGASYGGPVGLLLASIDKRIDRVILIASSPVMTLTEKKLKIAHRLGLDKAFSKFFIELFIGSSDRDFVDMDFVYDAHSSFGLVKAQIEILQQMNRRRLNSLKFMVDSVFNSENISITNDLKLDMPVLQIIGEKDNVWESRLSETYLKNFPLFKQRIIPKAKHRDLFLRADEFLKAAALMLTV